MFSQELFSKGKILDACRVRQPFVVAQVPSKCGDDVLNRRRLGKQSLLGDNAQLAQKPK
jgi:hypothetical protein